MQLSQYLKVYPCGDKPDHYLIFSTKQASVILLHRETYQAIENGTLSPSETELLTKHGIIVADRKAEQQDSLSLLDRCNAQNPNLTVTAVLNLDCNFACPYCYEGELKGHHYMSPRTAEQLTAFMRDKFTPSKNRLVVDFYGGEPLLSTDIITSVSRDMKTFTESRGVAFNFTLVTNGSLFTRKVADTLVPLGLESIKITLDGPAEIHNQSRPFKSGAGSFETIIRNIKATCDRVKIKIGGNYEAHNYKKFPLLLDDLQKAGLTPEKIPLVKFDPVMQAPQNDTSAAAYKGGCAGADEPWLIAAEALLREEILKRGYYTPKPGPMTCVVETADAYVVNYDGVIYKCPAFIGREDFAIGDLQNGIKDYSAPYKLGSYKNEMCAACEYLPLCFGGCRYLTFVKDGNIDALDCKKAYFDANLETLIKQDKKYR